MKENNCSYPDIQDFDAVLLDMDGTLVRLNFTDPDLTTVRNDIHDLFAEYGINRHFSPLLETIEESLETLEQFESSDTVESVRTAAYERIAREDRTAARHQSVYWRAKSFLDALKERNMPIIVVTNNSRSGAKIAIENSGLPEPDVLVTRNDVSKAKPYPEMIQTAINAVSVSVDSFVMIGDRPSDAEAAKRAVEDSNRAFTIQVSDRTHYVKQDKTYIDMEIQNLAALEFVLGAEV